MKHKLTLTKVIIILMMLYYSPFPSKGTASATGWRATSSTVDYINFPILVSTSNRIYALTGHNAAWDWYEYATINADGTLSQWTNIYYDGSLATKNAAGVWVNGNIYWGGGRSNIYGLLANSVGAIPILPNGLFGTTIVQTHMNKSREHHACVYSNSYIYALGGYTEVSVTWGGSVVAPTNTVEFAKETSGGRLGNWQYTSPLSADSGQMMGAWAANGYIYVLSATGNVERALQNPDGTLGPWQQIVQLPVAGVPVLSQQNILFVIGNGGVVYYAKVDPLTGEPGNWVLDPSPMAFPVNGQSAIDVNGFIYVVGGNANLVQYSPDSVNLNIWDFSIASNTSYWAYENVPNITGLPTIS